MLSTRLRQLRHSTGVAACQFKHHLRSTRTQTSKQYAPAVKPVNHDTDIEIAITAAIREAGLPLSNEQQLCQKLRSNWYSTAGDVAAMSKEEVQQLHMPVKLWVTIKSMVAYSTTTPASTAAAAVIETRADKAFSASIAQISSVSCGQQLQHTPLMQQQLHQGQRHLRHQPQQLPEQLHHASGILQLYQPSHHRSMALDAASGGELPSDMMQRRMPRNLYGQGAAAGPRIRVRHTPQQQEPYSLKDEEMPMELQAEFERLQQFSCGVFYGQRVEPMRPISFDAYRRELRSFLGFVHRVRGVSLDQLSLSTLLPSSGREGVSLLMDYQHWRQQERGTAARSQIMPIKACIALARFLYHGQSQPSAKPPYRDLEVVHELVNMLRAAKRKADAAPLVADESKKWLEWEEFLGMVRALQAECAGLTASGKPRSRSEVAASLQRYLIVAILSVVPDRQRTLRELEVGRTLQQRGGQWVIKHGPGDYKTGKKYGDRPPLVIAPFIYPELEAFISTWRQELQPKTSYLFCKPRTGEAHDDDSLYKIFTTAAQRLTGKATHPHLVRDMIVTHLRNMGTSEAEMESLALMMGHSLKEQRSTYDRRTKAQKVTPAVELMLELSKSLEG